MKVNGKTQGVGTLVPWLVFSVMHRAVGPADVVATIDDATKEKEIAATASILMLLVGLLFWCYCQFFYWAARQPNLERLVLARNTG